MGGGSSHHQGKDEEGPHGGYFLTRFLAVLFVDLSRRMLLPSSAGDHFYMVPFFSFFLLLSPFPPVMAVGRLALENPQPLSERRGKISFPTLPPGNRGDKKKT